MPSKNTSFSIGEHFMGFVDTQVKEGPHQRRLISKPSLRANGTRSLRPNDGPLRPITARSNRPWRYLGLHGRPLGTSPTACKILVSGLNGACPLSHGSRHSLDGTTPRVTGGKDAGPACLEIRRRPN